VTGLTPASVVQLRWTHYTANSSLQRNCCQVIIYYF